MSSMQRGFRLALHNHVFRTDTLPKYTSLWVGLFITKPDIDGLNGVEVDTTGTDYVRREVGPTDANWSILDASGKAVNTVDFVFPVPIADWGTITAWGIFDAEVDGELLIAGSLVVELEVLLGDLPPKFAPGDLTLTWG